MEAHAEKGKEIFPDEKAVLANEAALEWYLDDIFDNLEKFRESQFDPADPVFQEQQIYLATLQAEDFKSLFTLWEHLLEEAPIQLTASETFDAIHKEVYERKLIFNFKWMAWREGFRWLQDADFDFSLLDTLQISMLLTALFRRDRFEEGTLQQAYERGVLAGLFQRLFQLYKE